MGLVKKSYLVITDSGGLQKEAYYTGKRTLVIMPDTGWCELINIGWNRLVNENNLFDIFIKNILIKKHIKNIYGIGKSTKSIVKLI